MDAFQVDVNVHVKVQNCGNFWNEDEGWTEIRKNDRHMIDRMDQGWSLAFVQQSPKFLLQAISWPASAEC